MDTGLALAALIGLGSALVLMYAVLRNYTYPKIEEPFFSDPTLFKIFTVGLFEGTLLFVLYTYLWQLFTVVGLGFVVAILFGAIIEFAKLVTLNLKRFSGISDTIFYGFGLGLGLGAAMAFGMIYYWLKGELDVTSTIMVVMLALQYLLLGAANGVVVGEGVARRKPMEFTLQAVLYSAAFHLIIIPFYMETDVIWIKYVALIAASALAVFIFYRAIYRRLPKVVDDVLKMNGKTRNDIYGLK
ncbi:MAG: hypothetical protein PUK35_00295 [Methanomassiliicoccales archaeon]|uniref:hypothetical protein n=1 Tax=Candidatus Methanarcanum hacksteinii TaxID=2911857 RepID=UPI002A785010|nr:hypothetical protein [Candidatus Methanomethylophilaceae archaeon]MDD7478289.1 hypothetical protein [Methanomassiliicoccales archaeon]MDY4580197.1 hypothetical protein [Candidatus Methanarcanum hacksteinii]TQS76964.1 MAG: hypothetical protein A3204_06215 [Candidatus Methanarcanum hacksteinii]